MHVCERDSPLMMRPQPVYPTPGAPRETDHAIPNETRRMHQRSLKRLGDEVFDRREEIGIVGERSGQR